MSAGISNLIIATDSDEVDELVRGMTFLPSSNIAVFRDHGLGTHGLPVHCRRLLDKQFLFEAGHSLVTVDHYRKLCSAKEFTWSANTKSKNSTRYYYSSRQAYLGLPVAITDRDRYCDHIQQCDYDIKRFTDDLISNDSLRLIFSDMPLEFDTDEEMAEVLEKYEQRH